MLLSHKTKIKLNDTYANIIGHMGYAAFKLWNLCNYERRNYKELGLEEYPDWYYQKSHHKDNMWYRSLPSQTAQEVCKVLDGSWKSFYSLKESGGIKNPKPPRFKQDKIPITYMQNAIKRGEKKEEIRLSISKDLKQYMAKTYDIHEDYLFLKNNIFKDMEHIKQITLYPPEPDGTCQVIVVYEINDAGPQEDNGHYLSINLGLHNLMTCYDSDGTGFIVGRRYLGICQRYDKEIARVQSQWATCQAARKVKYPKTSKHVKRLYVKKKNAINDYLHKVTHYIVEYCKEHQITRCVIGDIRGIRKKKNMGIMTNQKLHTLPYDRIYTMLSYKLAKEGILLIKQRESYTSQCGPHTPEVSKKYAQKSNRKKRGLYVEEQQIYNADIVGAYNILRKYIAVSGIMRELSVFGLDKVKTIKVAV